MQKIKKNVIKLIGCGVFVLTACSSYACWYHYFVGCGTQMCYGTDVCNATISCLGTSTGQYDWIKSCSSGTWAGMPEANYTCTYACTVPGNQTCSGAPANLTGTATKAQEIMDNTSGNCNQSELPPCN